MNKTNYNESTIKFFFPQRENPPSSNYNVNKTVYLTAIYTLPFL